MYKLLLQAVASVIAMFSIAIAQDSIPQTAISFFNATSCPTGWVAYPDLEGRFVVPVIDSNAVGGQSGTAIPTQSEQAEPTHKHDFSGSFSIEAAEYVLVDGCCNDTLGHSGTYDYSGTSAFASAELPYIRMMACWKTDAPPAGAPAVPSNTLMFFDAQSCPTGWSLPPTMAGRFFVGLPEGGAPGGAFGGNSLSSLEQPAHAHDFEASVTLTQQYIAGASGCCAHDYSKNGTYTDKQKTATATLEYPYKQLLICDKD